MTKSKRAIIIEGKMFSSLKEAAEAFKLQPQSLYQALHRNSPTFKGYRIGYSVKTVNTLLNNTNTSQTKTRISFNGDKDALKAFRLQKMQAGKQRAKLARQQNASTTLQSNTRGNKKVPVKCLDTGKIYNTISEAARDAKIHMWTMSLKMEKNGKFIDKNGNTYVRLKPMVQRTNRQYCAGPANVSRTLIRTGKNTSQAATTKQVIISQEDMITQTLIKSANLLATSKKYSQAADVFHILASLNEK